MRFVTPQEDIDRMLAIEATVTKYERPFYLECMNNRPLSERIKSPLDSGGRDVRDGCILTGVFLRCWKETLGRKVRKACIATKLTKVEEISATSET